MSSPEIPRSELPARLARNLLVWIPVSLLVWLAITGPYNRFLIEAGENLMRLTERPDVTSFEPYERHHLILTRLDVRPQGLPTSIRVTSIHFHLVLLGALFLAVPGVPMRQRLVNLGYALLAAVVFHLVDLFFWVKFVYATQLGSWSAANYTPLARNFFGLCKHLLHLPYKLAVPLGLWAWFYLGLLLPPADEQG